MLGLGDGGLAVRDSPPGVGLRPAWVVGVGPAGQKAVVGQQSITVERPIDALVEGIGEAVDGWRDGGYWGVIGTARRLLSYWADREGAMLCLCYARRGAAETVVWLRWVTTRRGLSGGARDCYLTLGAYRG